MDTKILFVSNIFLLVLIGPMLVKLFYQKKKSLFALPVNMSLKIAAIVLAVWFLIGKNIYLSIYAFLILLLFFSMDIIVNDKGIYFFTEFMLWDDIKEISIDKLFFRITTKKGVFKKKLFVRFVWSVKEKDVEQIKLVRSKSGYRSDK